jgi:hypothetical protein
MWNDLIKISHDLFEGTTLILTWKGWRNNVNLSHKSRFPAVVCFKCLVNEYRRICRNAKLGVGDLVVLPTFSFRR